MLDLLTLHKVLEPLFPGSMGVRVVELSPGRVVGELEVRPGPGTTGGILHGVLDRP